MKVIIDTDFLDQLILGEIHIEDFVDDDEVPNRTLGKLQRLSTIMYSNPQLYAPILNGIAIGQAMLRKKLENDSLLDLMKLEKGAYSDD